MCVWCGVDNLEFQNVNAQISRLLYILGFGQVLKRDGPVKPRVCDTNVVTKVYHVGIYKHVHQTKVLHTFTHR